MIFKRLIARLKQNEQNAQPRVDSDKLDHEFVTLVRSLKVVLGKDLAENMIINFRHGESSIAISNLVNNIVELELPLTEEQRKRIAWLARTEDEWNERRWQELNVEMTTEQMRKHEVKDFRTHLLAEFREVYPEQKARSQ